MVRKASQLPTTSLDQPPAVSISSLKTSQWASRLMIALGETNNWDDAENLFLWFDINKFPFG